LRNTGRYFSVSTNERIYLCDRQGVPERFRGEVLRQEGFRGWVNVFRPGSHEALFRAPFILRHFVDSSSTRGSQKDILIHFTPKGPNAVPTRFASQTE
jgi:hypothetical protein